jgi:hypothetical protein
MCGSLNRPPLLSPGPPQCVVFNPYTKDDIVAIIKARLGTSAGKQGSENVCRLQVNAKPGPLLLPCRTLPTFCADPEQGLTFDTMAIEFLGRKVSGTSGDARKALDICKLAIDLAEAQAKKSGYAQDKKGCPYSVIGQARRAPIMKYCIVRCRDARRVRVTVSHMMNVFNTTDRPIVARIKVCAAAGAWHGRFAAG